MFLKTAKIKFKDLDNGKRFCLNGKIYKKINYREIEMFDEDILDFYSIGIQDFEDNEVEILVNTM